ncbi:efflux RND transporter permease subunit [Peribacillus cavernae]|uniref:Efflux RND transporter permease subunit n=1 Tax=Peribacillus cavernae TaxID=1674310 RepID=A0A3S0W337_9BACI|nr:efflux RND transporter permease subunit [Peribacillus cavernae]MDQ0219579.1 HAE1 family hydrophobic/amphiphilic exporter-1 [Peribacillus cavernae]RUQ25871.1 efflux RND transporter permease subunit [Peribacillus cavernae]
MNFLTKFSLKNAAAVFIISFLFILGGVYSFTQLKVAQFPDIEFPQISVEAVYPGASPEDVSTQVTSRLENQFKSIEGTTKLTSSSFESVGMINLEFPFDTDMDQVEQQINTFVKDASLPDEVEVNVSRFSFGSFPIYNISLFGKEDNNIDKLLKEDVIPELNKIQGINSVSVGGFTDNLVQITVNKKKAAEAGLSLQTIKEQINGKFLSFPAGQLSESDLQIPIRVEEKLDTVKKLESLQLTASAQAAPGPSQSASGPRSGSQAGPSSAGTEVSTPKLILLKDIAKVETVSEQSEKARFDEKDALSMAITKKQDANTVDVADDVIKVLDKYKNELDYSIGLDSATDVKKSVSSLVKEGLLGALFASIAVLLFLRNIRATLIAIVSIPLSLLVSAIFLKQLDVSLNIMTLGGMAVAVGRVVDDSIVVIENIFRRVRKSTDGMTNTIILDSTKEILKAITSSTITTVVVFLPLAFIGGITGEFFLPFALTIVFSLLASLFVAVTIVPIMAKLAFKKVPKEEKEGHLQRAYGKMIEYSLNHKTSILTVSALLLAGSLAIVPTLGFTFIPNEDQRTLTASIELPAASALEKTDELSIKIEKMLDQQDDVEHVTASIGSRDFLTGLKLENKASYFVNLTDQADVQASIARLQNKMEKLVKEDEANTKVTIEELNTSGPPTNNNVDIDLFSNDLEALEKAAKQVENYMKDNEDLKYVSSNFTDKQKQYLVQIDSEKSSLLGLSGYQILGTINDQTSPVSAGELTLNGKEQEVQLTYDKDLKTEDDLKGVFLFTPQGPVPLSEAARVKQVESFTSIQRLDGKVYARVSAQVKGNDVRTVSQEVTSGIKTDITLPVGVSLESGGGSYDTVEIFQSIGVAIIVAIGLVYLTMLITFGKARIPFVILSSLLFIPVGSLIALYLMQEPLSVSVMIGFLMLIGIVTTNAIVLVDRVGQNREERGMPIRESLMEAGKTRLRPILMTAFATITALLPLALTTSSGTLISKGLAITVIGGLTSSTLLTLIIVPVVYELFFINKAKKESG